MKNLAKLPHFKQILFVIILFISCIATFHGFALFLPICTTYMTRGFEILPSMISIIAGPLFTLIMYWIYINAKNQQRKWKTLNIYGIVMTALMLVCAIAHIITMSTHFGFGLFGNVSYLFPYDVLVMQILFMALGILSIVYSIKTREYRNVVPTVAETISKGKIAAFSTVVAFATHFAGAAIAFPYVLIDGYFDPNWWAMIPMLLMFYIPIAMVLTYLYYLDTKDDKVYYRGLLIIGGAFAILLIWVLIAFAVNPRFIYESMCPFFLFGFSLKIPLGFYILLGLSLVLLLIAGVKFIIKYTSKKKYEQE